MQDFVKTAKEMGMKLDEGQVAALVCGLDRKLCKIEKREPLGKEVVLSYISSIYKEGLCGSKRDNLKLSDGIEAILNQGKSSLEKLELVHAFVAEKALENGRNYDYRKVALKEENLKDNREILARNSASFEGVKEGVYAPQNYAKKFAKDNGVAEELALKAIEALSLDWQKNADDYISFLTNFSNNLAAMSVEKSVCNIRTVQNNLERVAS